jgi:CDP-diacylglycerol--serine O-phosphatidyltransferase
MHWFKNNLANFFTLGNLACGFMAIVFVLNPLEEMSITLPFWLMILAAVLDFFDGFIARATNSTSTIGADLDSLADVVTFGVLPGIMIWSVFPGYFKFTGIIIPLLSAWRLAKFNNDTRGNEFFYGLPTPANALLVGGIYVFHLQYIVPRLNGPGDNYLLPVFILFFTALVYVFSALMVSNVKLLSNKISPLTLPKAKWHIIVLSMAVILITLLGYLGISFAVISYVLISIIANFANSKSTEE